LPSSNETRNFVVFLLLLVPLTLSGVHGESGTQPLILIYCQDEHEYGAELSKILQADTRMDAETLVLSDPQLFRTMIYFPYVKVIVAVFNHDRNDGVNLDLETFFDEGGGLVGMGFAGWRSTTGNASMRVFPLNASHYVTGKYDRDRKVFTQQLYVDRTHEISEGVGNFTANAQKVIMRFNRTSGMRLPPVPKGKLTVLYRESTSHAPALVAYEERGVSVTFGCFDGNSVTRAPTYFRRFTDQQEFRTLFKNSVYWVWKNEHRYEGTLKKAREEFLREDEDLKGVRARTERSDRARQTFLLARSSGIVILMLVSIAIIWKICFSKGKEERLNQHGEELRSGEVDEP